MRFFAWMLRLRRRNAIEAEMRAEMEFHQQARAADLQARRGLSPQAAARQASLDFGSIEAHREEGRAAFGFRWIDELRGDLRFAWRGLRKSPGFTLATVGILALAIGVNSAFFTLYSNYVLKPLPVRGAERHYEISGRDRQAARISSWTPDEIRYMREAAREQVEGIYSASGPFQILLLAPAQRYGMIVAVSANYFTLLGGQPVLGRTLSEAEERLPVAVLSDAGWKRLFPGHESPVGQAVRVRSTWFSIVGVMPPAFTGTAAAVPDLWVGAGMAGALREDLGGDRRHAYGLLKPGVTASPAEAALTAAATRFVRPGEEPVARIELQLHDTYLGADLEDASVLAALLFAVFLLVLLIACANLANLFLARMAARAHEIAIRFSLGAARSRVVRQLLTEAAVPALLGAAAGLALSALSLTNLHAWLFSVASMNGATVLPVVLDWRVFVWSGLLGLIAGAAFGLLPALQATAIVRGRPGRLRTILLSGQVAASFILLILAGVLVRNIQRLDGIRAGYDLEHTFDLNYEPVSPDILARLRSHPGVAGVSAVQRVPLYGRLDRHPAEAAGKTVAMAVNTVDENYFDALGISLVSGRSFYRPEAAAGARVAVVSEATARRLWPGGAAVGQTLTFPAGAAPSGVYEVIGIAPDIVNGWLSEGPEPAVAYLPGAAGQALVASAIVRLIDSRPAALAALREACLSVPGGIGCEPKSLREVAAMQRFLFQIAAAVAGLLGGIALLLTAIGLYSVVSYSVEQRKREIGVLIAVGARPVHVMRRVLRETVRCLVIGLAAGLPVCLWLSWLATSSVFQIRTFDPAAYLSVPVLLMVIAALACLVPVRRALGVQPIIALRQE